MSSGSSADKSPVSAAATATPSVGSATSIRAERMRSHQESTTAGLPLTGLPGGRSSTAAPSTAGASPPEGAAAGATLRLDGAAAGDAALRKGATLSDTAGLSMINGSPPHR